MYKHLHLSDRAKNLGWNVFIFWPSSSAVLLGGINNKLNQHVTFGHILRWIQIIDQDFPESTVFRAVNLTRPGGILAYNVRPCEGKQPLAENKLLEKGFFAIYTKEKLSEDPARAFPRWELVKSFKEGSAYSRTHLASPTNLSLDNMSPELRLRALSESQNVCCITGKPSEDTCWIFPPSRMFRLPSKYDDQDQYEVIANVVVMRQDVIDLFEDNAFSIDVDDGYAIVWFKEHPLMSVFPKDVSALAKRGHASDCFLRNHFRWSLVAHFIKGEAKDQYTQDDVDAYVLELGLEEGQEPVPDDDKRWDTTLGRAIRNYFGPIESDYGEGVC